MQVVLDYDSFGSNLRESGMTQNLNEVQTKSQLGELALDAAIALEGASSSRNLDVIRQFLNAVKSQLSEDAVTSGFRDTSLYPVYSYALSKTEGPATGTVEDFRVRLAHTIANHEQDQANDTDVERLKRFCLAVHEALLIDLMGRRASNTRNDARIR
jgi:hypothetical protein